MATSQRRPRLPLSAMPSARLTSRERDLYGEGEEPPRFGELNKLLPVFLVIVTIVFLYIQYFFLHCLRLLQLDLPDVLRDSAAQQRASIQLGCFHVVTLLLLYCLLRCLLTFPGTIPDSQGWDLQSEVQAPVDGEMKSVEITEKKTTGERRHCKWCLKYKPDRCHHCRICNVCVLRMDHHCPWVYNCIGFRNHKYFILLLIYSAIDLLFIGVTMFESVWWSTRTDVNPSLMLLMVFAECFVGFLATVNILFLGFHGWLTVKAMTTLEFCEKSMKMASYDSSIYSRGVYDNICAVLGPNPLLWLLPCSLPKGDGLTWKS